MANINKFKMLYGKDVVEINEDTIFISKKDGNLIIKGDIIRNIGNRICIQEKDNIATVMDGDYEWYINIIQGNESEIGKITNRIGSEYRITKRADGHHLVDKSNNEISYFGIISDDVYVHQEDNKDLYTLMLYKSYNRIGTLLFSECRGRILDKQGYLNRASLINDKHRVFKVMDTKTFQYYSLEVDGKIISRDKKDYFATNSYNFVQCVDCKDKCGIVDIRNGREWNTKFSGYAEYIGYSTFILGSIVVREDKCLYAGIKETRKVSSAGLVTFIFDNGALLMYNAKNGELFNAADFPKQFKYVNIDNRVIRIDMSDYNVFVDITTMTEIR